MSIIGDGRMKRAALVVEGEGFGKSISMLFGKPWQLGKVSFNVNEEEYEIILLEVPYTNNPKAEKKSKDIVEKYCKNMDIQALIYKNTQDDKTDEKLIAIKIVNTLQKIENSKVIDLFKKRFGIILNSLNPMLIDALSIEASSIIIMDQGFDREKTEKLYQEIIRDKGLSIVYTKDLTVLIKKSDIILCENPMIIEIYKDFLFDKIILCNDWSKIVLLPRSISSFGLDLFDGNYYDDVLEIFLSFNDCISVWEAAKWLLQK